MSNRQAARAAKKHGSARLHTRALASDSHRSRCEPGPAPPRATRSTRSRAGRSPVERSAGHDHGPSTPRLGISFPFFPRRRHPRDPLRCQIGHRPHRKRMTVAAGREGMSGAAKPGTARHVCLSPGSRSRGPRRRKSLARVREWVPLDEATPWSCSAATASCCRRCTRCSKRAGDPGLWPQSGHGRLPDEPLSQRHKLIDGSPSPRFASPPGDGSDHAGWQAHNSPPSTRSSLLRETRQTAKIEVTVNERCGSRNWPATACCGHAGWLDRL